MVDTQGIADDAVDVEGWSYATDFGWLHMPPAAGAGKFRRVRLAMSLECLLVTQPHCRLWSAFDMLVFVHYCLLCRVMSLCKVVATSTLQVRDYVRRRRWIRNRVRKPAEQQPGTAVSSAANSPIFATSSSSTGPIFNRPSSVYAAHDDQTAGNASFSSQRSGYAGAIAPNGGSQPYWGNLHGNSSHSLGGVQSSKTLGQEERPYMNLSEVRQGLSAECNKWGSSVVSELHKAISSAGDGEH